MGIHNSSNLPIEQRVGNPITEKNHQKNNMKAFTTACALIAGVSAEAQIPYFTTGVAHPPIASYVPITHQPINYGIQSVRPFYSTYGIGIGVHHPMTAGHLIKREAEAEPRSTYQSKVEHPNQQSVYEYRVNVDRMGNGNSYQFHEQQRDNMMRQQQR